MEYIFLCNIMKYFEEHNLSHSSLRGFRKMFSCETKLPWLVHDNRTNMDNRKAFSLTSPKHSIDSRIGTSKGGHMPVIREGPLSLAGPGAGLSE